jgi:hypothetical protein
MKNHGRIVGVVVLVLILAAAIGIALWPVALVQAAFGRDIGPDASRSAEAGAWVATGLVRVAGMLVGAFAAMILATWTKSVASRGVFAVVGGLAVLVAAIQWAEVLPSAVGLGVTALCVLLVASGFLALPNPARHARA